LVAYALASVLPAGNALDLFAGAGGLSLGFELAGFRSILAVDNDEAALRTYALNRLPLDNLTLRADLGTREGMEAVVSEMKRRLRGDDLRILLGGPPCQGFSTAGKNHSDDPRNRLVWNYFDLVDTLKPQIVLFENVPAVMWGSNRGVIERLQSEFARIGYFSSVAVLHAEGYGVPQLRRRLFLLASRDSTLLNWPAPTHAIVPPHMGRMQPGGISADLLPAQTVCDAIRDLPFTPVLSPDLVTGYQAAPSSDLQRWLRGNLELKSCFPSATSVGASIEAAHLQLELNT
jgi:DNA (cytosine-5)-methyltransferase 1